MPYCAVDHRYKLPRSLKELKLVVPAERKPAALAALLQVRNARCGAASTPGGRGLSRRPALLLEALHGSIAAWDGRAWVEPGDGAHHRRPGCLLAGAWGVRFRQLGGHCPTKFSPPPCHRSVAALPRQELRGESTIVFTSSVEATHRLHLLLAALTCLPDGVVEFSSLVPPAERAKHLEAFRSGQAKVWRAGPACACMCARVCVCTC